MKLPYTTLVVLVSLLGAAGCGLFDTRTPEPPNETHSNFLPPTSAEIVLQNFQAAIREKDASNYLRCFVDTLNSTRSYRYIPTATAAGKYASVFSNWTLQSERSYFTSLTTFVPQGTAPSLVLANGSFTGVSSDSATYFAEYTLTMPHGLTGIPETVRGNIQLVIAVNRNTFWEIVTWNDLQHNDEPSWSELKGRFAN
jgi:hypothetical protein